MADAGSISGALAEVGAWLGMHHFNTEEINEARIRRATASAVGGRHSRQSHQSNSEDYFSHHSQSLRVETERVGKNTIDTVAEWQHMIVKSGRS